MKIAANTVGIEMPQGIEMPLTFLMEIYETKFHEISA
jgi:hypothetical protein